jgi:DNA-3-methyladenine glycosylase II
MRYRVRGNSSQEIKTMLYTKSGVILAQPPFDFGSSLAFLGMFPAMQGEQTTSHYVLTKAVRVDGVPLVFGVRARGDSALACTLYAEQPITEALERAAKDRIAFFLSLNDDLRPFYALAEGDDLFAPVVQRLYGHHQVKFLTPFECACWAILSQRTPMNVAQSVKQHMSEALGSSLVVEGVTYHAFPDPAQILAADDLPEVVANVRKVEYLRSAARAFEEPDESWLRDAPSDEVEAWLLRIKGIGAWSARFILIRGLGHMDRLSVGEDRMGEAVRKRYGALTEAQIAEIGARYGDYRGYWAYYLRAAS